MPHIPRVVCVECYVEMKLQRAVLVRMICAIGDYYTIQGDVHQCPRCEHRVIAGWAQNPSAHAHDQEEYQQDLKHVDLTVDLEPHIKLSRREETIVVPGIECHRCRSPGTQLTLGQWWCRACGHEQEAKEARQ